MKISDGIFISLRDIKRRKLRSILTIIAISVGSMLLVAMQGMGTSISSNATKFITSFGSLENVIVMPQKYESNYNFATSVNLDSSSTMLPYVANKQESSKTVDLTKIIDDNTVKSVSQIKNVNSVSAYNTATANSVSLNGIDKTASEVTVQGYSKNYDYSTKILYGNQLSGNPNEFLVDEAFLKNLGITDYSSAVGKTITITVHSQILSTPLTITGTIKGIFKQGTFDLGDVITYNTVTNKMIDYSYGLTTASNSQSTYSMISLYANSQSDVNAITSTINNNLGYETFNLGQIVGLASIFVGFVNGLLDLAAIIVVIVAGIGLVNTMNMTVQEKKKWIGIMGSLGASKSNIRFIFLSQSVILGTLGAILGSILGYIGLLLINQYLIMSGKDFTIVITPWIIISSIIITIVVSIIAGLIPASKAAKLNVIEIINEE
ncbi:MAG: ABC transporter permease [Clostridium perfringens]|nr:ABC transporter permease [Clostridium perfringens]